MAEQPLVYKLAAIVMGLPNLITQMDSEYGLIEIVKHIETAKPICALGKIDLTPSLTHSLRIII